MKERVADGDGVERHHVVWRGDVAIRHDERVDRLEEIGPLAQRVEFVARQRRLVKVTGQIDAKEYQTARFTIGERCQQHAAEDREDRGRGADPECHDADRGDRERWVLDQNSHAVTNVAQKGHAGLIPI